MRRKLPIPRSSDHSEASYYYELPRAEPARRPEQPVTHEWEDEWKNPTKSLPAASMKFSRGSGTTATEWPRGGAAAGSVRQHHKGMMEAEEDGIELVHVGMARRKTGEPLEPIIVEMEMKDAAPHDIVVFQQKGLDGDSRAGVKMAGDEEDEEGMDEVDRVTDEGAFALAIQAIPSLLLAAMGLFLAGWLLDFVQYSELFLGVPEMFILVPVLLGLKGNLEMNLASRMSTAAGLGKLNKRKTRNKVIAGNILLLQVQAIVVGSFSGLHSLFLGSLSHSSTNGGGNTSDFKLSLLVVTSSVLTACLASLILGTLMCGLVLLCNRFKINPANVAAPLASSMGDLLTLFLMWVLGNFLYVNLDEVYTPVIAIVSLSCLPVLVFFTWRNSNVKHVLIHGWIPLVGAMFISSAAGITLESSVRKYPALALLVPVMNGLGGNIGAIYASRRSTFLHADASEDTTKSQLTLFSLITPLLLCFMLTVKVFDLASVEMSLVFVSAILIVGMLQVTILLVVGRVMVEVFWRFKLDPDDYVLPLLSALGDIIGTGILVGAFNILASLGRITVDTGTGGPPPLNATENGLGLRFIVL